MAIFYTPDIDKHPFLSQEESGHCVRVLRLSVGDEITLCDGKGNFYKAIIADANAKRCAVEVQEVMPQENRLPKVCVAVAPTKNMDRMEWLVEKLTEMGVDAICFLQTRFSERKVLNTERLQKIAVSAMKQSQRATLPEIGELMSFKDFVRKQAQPQRFICHCYPESEAGQRQFIKEVDLQGQDVLVMIGPEGDFSLEEVQLARELGFVTLSLGPMRLRTETAAMLAGMMLRMQSL
nr:16S rRNA (uracil(1498)-N(3))-methyltransferase [Bacteroidales bacterium]